MTIATEYGLDSDVTQVFSPAYDDDVYLDDSDLANALAAGEIEITEFDEYVYKTQGGFITAKHVLE